MKQKNQAGNHPGILLITGVMLLISLALPAPGRSGEIRGLWVVRHTLTTPPKIDSLVSRAREWGITDLFVQVRGRGDAYYNSHVEPKAGEIPDPEFDPLRYLLRKTRGTGLRVHAWLNVLYVWSADSLPADSSHLARSRAGWMARPMNGDSLLHDYPAGVKNARIEGLYLSPLLPAVQEQFLSILRDLLNQYSIDGVHLDYIRYPNRNFDFHPDVVKGFRSRYVLDPKSFLLNPDRFADRFSVSGYESFSRYWRNYLMDGLSDFVRRISQTVKQQSERLMVSAAVKPDILLARWDYYQDWERWLREKWLDYAVPMNYTPDANLFRKRLETYIDQLPEGRFLVGIALYNQSERQVARKLKQVQAIEPAGWVLFSYNQLPKMPELRRWLRSTRAEAKALK